MLIDMHEAIADRACAAIDNLRALELKMQFQLTPAAAWVLAMLEADRSGLSADDIHHESQTERHPFFRKEDLMQRLIAQIQDRLGKDATLTEQGVVKLTPLGRLRTRSALGASWK